MRFKIKLFFLFLLISVSIFSVDMEIINQKKAEIFKDRNMYLNKYEHIENLIFNMKIASSNGEDEKAENFFNQAVIMLDKFKIFVNNKPVIDSAESKVKLLEKYFEEASEFEMVKLYARYFSNFEYTVKETRALFDNGKKAENDFDEIAAFELDRFNTIIRMCDEILEDVRLYIDNSGFYFKTGQMVEELAEKIAFSREKFYSAIKPDMFGKIVERYNNTVKYHEELKENLSKDRYFIKKDYFYTFIRNETEYSMNLLLSIINSPDAEKVDNIWKLEKIIRDYLNNSRLVLFFPQNINEMEELFNKTMSVRPYGNRDLIVMEDDLLSYKQILDNYSGKISRLDNHIQTVKEKYKTLVEIPERFDTVSYELLNDISEYIIRGEKAFVEGNYDLCVSYYEKAEDFIERQTVIIELFRFNLRMEEYVEKYQIDKAFPSTYRNISEKLSLCIDLSKKGKFSQAYEIIKNIKDELSTVISKRRQQVTLLEKYGKRNTDDFIVYRVKSGDNLTKIAVRYYGNSEFAWNIWAWNFENYPNPDSIYVGNLLKLYTTEEFIGDRKDD